MNKEIKNLIKEIKELKYLDWELDKTYELIEQLENEKLKDTLIDWINDKYITCDEHFDLYIEAQQMDGGADLDRLRHAIGDATYSYPLYINGYGNLKNQTEKEFKDELINYVELIEQLESESK